MYEQFNTKQLLAMSKQFSDTAFKAHSLAIAGFEKAIDLQLKTLETNVNATVGFWTEASEIRDLDGARTLFPKSVALAKDSAEKMYSVSQELVGLSVKTTEAINDLVKGNYEVANDAFVAAKTVSSKKK